MAANQNDLLANLQQQMADMTAELNRLKAAQPREEDAVAAAVRAQEQRQAVILGSFLKSPLKLHREVNPDHVVLSFNSANWAQWEESIDGTLQYAFSLTELMIKKSNNFSNLATEYNHAITSLMKNTIEKSLLGIIKAAGHKTAKDVFEALKLKCERSDRRHKIDLLNNLLELANANGLANEVTMSAWAKVNTELEAAKLTVDELVGILLQMSYKPAVGVELTKFKFTVDQNLNEKKSPLFADVATVIQLACGKVNKKQTDHVPMDLDRIQAFNQRAKGKYVTPQQRNLTDRSTKLSHLCFAVERAEYYKGKGQTEEQEKRYGTECACCGEDGHWFADCSEYWRAVALKQIKPPPADFESKGSKYIPPRRSEHHVRKVAFPNLTEGVLLDSGASAHGNNSNASREDHD